MMPIPIRSLDSVPRRRGSLRPWLEIAAWILAFALVLGAPCAPERSGDVGAQAGHAANRRSR